MASNLSKRLVELSSFAMRENVRLSHIPKDSVELSKRMRTFAWLNGSGKRSYDVGGEVISRLQQFAFDYVKARGLSQVVSVSQVARYFEKEIADGFLGPNQKPSQAAASLMLQRVDRVIATSVSRYTFYWPCHISMGQAPAEFEIGGMRFRSRAAFEPIFERTLDECLDRYRDDASSTIVTDKLGGYYKRFGWSAEVSLEASDFAAARRRSLEAVHIALSGLRILIGGHTESKMRVSEYPNHDFEKGLLYRKGEVADYSWSWTSESAHFRDDWWEGLNVGPNLERLNVLSSIVRSAYQPELETFLKRKFLNALLWFGEGTLDTIAASMLAKFVNAVESLTSCDERDRLAETVSTRVASLTYDPTEPTFAERKRRFKQIYNVRSELVHGSRSPLGLEIGQFAHDAGRFARFALAGFLDFLVHIGVERDDYNNHMLAKDFEIIEGNVLRAEASATCAAQ